MLLTEQPRNGPRSMYLVKQSLQTGHLLRTQPAWVDVRFLPYQPLNVFGFTMQLLPLDGECSASWGGVVSVDQHPGLSVLWMLFTREFQK